MVVVVVVVVVAVVVVITLIGVIKSVVTRHVPVMLEWRNTPRRKKHKQKQKGHTNISY